MQTKVLVLGGGHLGGAIATRLSHVGQAVWVVDRNEAKLQQLRAQGVPVATVNLRDVPKVDVAIVAVKPTVTLVAVAELLAPVCAAQPEYVVSVAAGLRQATLQAAVAEHPEPSTRDGNPTAAKTHVVGVRAMMNTAVAQGLGCVVLATDQVPAEVLKRLEALFAPLGVVFSLPDGLFDAATSVSASAPAFFLTAMDGLADGGVRLGLKRETAEAMSIAAARAAVAVTEQGSLAQARAAIVSPAGSTAEGLAVLERAAMRAAFADAAHASALAAATRANPPKLGPNQGSES